jgi:hypothetical protein
MKVYDIYTDLDPDMLGAVAAETYYIWLMFACGQTDIGGKKLKHPSGRYASALSWKKTGRNMVSIIADDDAIPEVGIIEDGSPEIDLKAKMLTPDKAKRSKAGYLYRTLYLRPDGARRQRSAWTRLCRRWAATAWPRDSGGSGRNRGHTSIRKAAARSR